MYFKYIISPHTMFKYFNWLVLRERGLYLKKLFFLRCICSLKQQTDPFVNHLRDYALYHLQSRVC